jgi:acetolactate synthase I/II/III large subunit
MTKWACAVPSADRLAELFRRALRESFTGRPGVVHIDVPESVMNGTYDVNPAWFRAPSTYRLVEPLQPAPSQVERAAELLLAAQRPLIHAGSGVLWAGATDELREVASLLGAAVTTSWAARAAIDERFDWAVPMPFLDAVNQARTGSDVALVLGSRLGETDWWGKAPYWGRPDAQALIHVDIDPAVIGNNRPADLGIQADVKAFLTALLARLRGSSVLAVPRSRRAFLDGLQKACRERRKKLDKHVADDAVPMDSAHVARVCQDVFPGDAILVVDGGNTAIWAHFFHEVRSPNTLLATAKMGMLGAGVAQALGAQVAHPDRHVYCIIGDGAMGFHPQEVETAVRNNLPVIYLVLCDKQWGMVKMNQQFALKPVKTLLLKSLGPDETINADLHEIEFDQLARSMGAHGERVADPRGLRGALERSIASGKCAVIHVDVDPVKHMWAPNLRAFKDMHAEPKG